MPFCYFAQWPQCSQFKKEKRPGCSQNCNPYYKFYTGKTMTWTACTQYSASKKNTKCAVQSVISKWCLCMDGRALDTHWLRYIFGPLVSRALCADCSLNNFSVVCIKCCIQSYTPPESPQLEEKQGHGVCNVTLMETSIFIYTFQLSINSSVCHMQNWFSLKKKNLWQGKKANWSKFTITIMVL